MRWIVPVLFAVAACGGTQIPTHNGYKGGDKAKPWKKPKTLAFDDQGEAKADGDLSYAGFKRARWYQVNLPANGELALRVEINPPGDATNEEFDLGFEVLDSGYRVIAKSDLEEPDAYELTKNKKLVDLVPGVYYIHLYLQSRVDSADYSLRASFKRTAAAEVKSNFPAEVEFVPALAMVPITDDTPKNYKPTPTVITRTPRRPGTQAPPPPKDKPAAAGPLRAPIISIAVVSGGTQITVARGTEHGAAQGMKGQIPGVANSGFTLASCSPRTCVATVPATPDQIKGGGGAVVLTP